MAKRKTTAMVSASEVAKTNKSLLPKLEESESIIKREYASAEVSFKAICVECAKIATSELYKARGFTSLAQYCGQYLPVKASSISNYVKVGKDFYLSELPSRQAIAETCDYTTLAELRGITDREAVEFADTYKNGATAKQAREFRAKMEKQRGGVQIVKTYSVIGRLFPIDGKGESIQILEDSIITEDLYKGYNLNPNAVHRIKKEESTSVKDSFMYTCMTRDCNYVGVFTMTHNVNKPATVTSLESRKASIKDYLASLSPEELKAFLADIN